MNYLIVIGSPVDYIKLVAYIVIDGIYIAMVNQEEGIDKLKIEFFDEAISNPAYCDVFIQALNEARTELIGRSSGEIKSIFNY